MKFMVMVKSAEQSAPPPQALMDGIAQLGVAAAEAGVIVETGGLLPSAQGARIRIRKKKLSITDGPFTESKEIIGGYAVYQVNTREEALEWTRRFMELHREHWPEWEGEAEIRQIFEMPVPDGSSLDRAVRTI